jgi:hypothetical protein
MTNFINGSRLGVFEVAIIIECTLLKKESNFVSTIQKVIVSNMFLIFGGTGREFSQRVAIKAEILKQVISS